MTVDVIQMMILMMMCIGSIEIKNQLRDYY